MPPCWCVRCVTSFWARAEAHYYYPNTWPYEARWKVMGIRSTSGVIVCNNDPANILSEDVKILTFWLHIVSSFLPSPLFLSSSSSMARHAQKVWVNNEPWRIKKSVWRSELNDVNMHELRGPCLLKGIVLAMGVGSRGQMDLSSAGSVARWGCKCRWNPSRRWRECSRCSDIFQWSYSWQAHVSPCFLTPGFRQKGMRHHNGWPEALIQVHEKDFVKMRGWCGTAHYYNTAMPLTCWWKVYHRSTKPRWLLHVAALCWRLWNNNRTNTSSFPLFHIISLHDTPPIHQSSY